MHIAAHARRIMRHNSESLIPLEGAEDPMDHVVGSNKKVSHPTDHYSENQLNRMTHAELASLSAFDENEIRRRREHIGMNGRDAAVRENRNNRSYYLALAEKHGIGYRRLLAGRKRMPDLSLTEILKELKATPRH